MNDFEQRRWASSSPVVDRLVSCALVVVYAPTDTTTVMAWSKLAGLSRTSLCERARILGFRAKDLLSFARLARTLVVADGGPWCPEIFLEHADRRTLEALLRRGGLLQCQHQATPPLAALFRHHSFRLPDVVLRGLAARLNVDPDNGDGVGVATPTHPPTVCPIDLPADVPLKSARYRDEESGYCRVTPRRVRCPSNFPTREEGS